MNSLPPSVARAIHSQAILQGRRLRRYGHDPDDVRQEFWLCWFRRGHQYDPQRSSPQTFISHVCRRRAISMREAATAAKRGGAMVYANSELPTADRHGRPIERPENVSVDTHEMRLGLRSRSAVELAGLRLDVCRVVTSLPSELADVARLLAMGEPMVNVAARLRISRATLHRRVGRLREIFSAAGLGVYLRDKGAA
jgi:DNA-directed RNA polymerase specialized sigma24 family protein